MAKECSGSLEAKKGKEVDYPQSFQKERSFADILMLACKTHFKLLTFRTIR